MFKKKRMSEKVEERNEKPKMEWERKKEETVLIFHLSTARQWMYVWPLYLSCFYFCENVFIDSFS